MSEGGPEGVKVEAAVVREFDELTEEEEEVEESFPLLFLRVFWGGAGGREGERD